MRMGRCRAACLLVALTALCAQGTPAADSAGRLEREMRIHRVESLGLEIWSENQPPWEAGVASDRNLPAFVVRSPADYYPPAVMTYVSVPGTVIQEEGFQAMAIGAIREAARHYGVPAGKRLTLNPQPRHHGSLAGYEAVFDGTANGEDVQVRIFVGRAEDRFPVAMQVYTLRGKLDHVAEPVRRAWDHVNYLR